MNSCNTAVVIIDFINDIVSPDLPWASCSALFEERKIAEKANALSFLMQKNSTPIIHVKIGFEQDYSDLPKTSLMFAKAFEKGIYKLNTLGNEFHKNLNVAKEDYIIIKKRVSPFYATSLDTLLKSKNVFNLIIFGASTNNAVQACARDAHDRDYLPIVMEDMCAARNLEDHNNALIFMSHFSKIVRWDDFKENYKTT